MVGLFSPDRTIDNWGDLDGEVGTRRGWWVHANDLEKIILEGETTTYRVIAKFEHHGIQLKDKSCRVLTTINDKGNLIFVEFDEHVNGCSADGLGKNGHCVALKASMLIGQSTKKTKHAK